MKRIGRNAPCPCGSGKKYKKCCLRHRVQGPGFTVVDRRSAYEKLFIYAHDLPERCLEDAAEEFWGPYREAAGDLTQTIDVNNPRPGDGIRMASREAFYCWLLFDYRPDLERRLSAFFLNSGVPLTGGERRCLEQTKSTSMRLYEVVEVRPGSGMTLRDLVRGDDARVRDRISSRGIHKWDLVTTRVIPVDASGRLEVESGQLIFPRHLKNEIVAELEANLDGFRRDCPGVDDLEFFEVYACHLHQTWLKTALGHRLPKLVDSEGEAILLTRVYFDVLDAAKLTAALDGSEALVERDKHGPTWHWYPPGARAESEREGKSTGDPEESISLASLLLQDDRLILETLSKERAEQGRAMVEELAGDAVRYRLASHQDPSQALRDLDPQDTGDTRELSPEEAEEAEETIIELFSRHYRAWLDEEIPALDGTTPRAAARSAELRSKLVELLRDLEHSYEQALSLGQPGFDPSWMWAELGLGDAAEAPTQHEQPPLTGIESMERQIPGIGDLARGVAERFRRRTATTLTAEAMSTDLPLVRFLEHQAMKAYKAGSDSTAATERANLIAVHLEHMCNYELHHRKIFWVEDSLAWMLGRTKSNVTGDLLRLPFASFAVIFDDRYTLGLAERLLSLDPACELRGRMLRVATAYVSELPAGSAHGVRVAFTFDALTGQWPYLFTRDLCFQPTDDLETILDSHFPDVDVQTLDSLYSSAPLKHLLRLLINAILYATSTGVEPETRSAPASSSGRGPSRQSVFSSEEVYFLPGKIDISQVRRMQTVARAPSGRKLMLRFMVRGHWRRPNPSWKDQRPRWIKPFWKGPDIAATIERAYRMRP